MPLQVNKQIEFCVSCFGFDWVYLYNLQNYDFDLNDFLFPFGGNNVPHPCKRLRRSISRKITQLLCNKYID